MDDLPFRFCCYSGQCSSDWPFISFMIISLTSWVTLSVELVKLSFAVLHQ
jgi:hypothetical protein